MPWEQCNGADIYYEETGSGTSIVFLHGAFAGSRFFKHQSSQLPPNYHVITLDFRGHGRSSKPDTGHTVTQYARDVRTFFEQRELDDVVLVGWSMGALVAWEYIDQFGMDSLDGLVVIDQPASDFEWDDYDHGGIDLMDLTEFFAHAQTEPLSLIDGVTEAIFKDPVSDERRAWVFDELSRVSPLIQCTVLFNQTMVDYRELLPDITIPVLVCAGADETVTSVSSVKYVADHVPDAEFELFEDSGHCPPVEEPDRFNRVIRDFVESL